MIPLDTSRLENILSVQYHSGTDWGTPVHFFLEVLIISQNNNNSPEKAQFRQAHRAKDGRPIWHLPELSYGQSVSGIS